MARKKGKETIDLLVEVFQEYPGSELVEYLKDGACLQATVDDECFSLEKADGVLFISEGELESPDLTVWLNREACEYLSSSEEVRDFVTRTRQCIRGTHDDCRMTYEVNASVPRLLMKGYLDFMRKLGLV
jgi:hypothetical protein